MILLNTEHYDMNLLIHPDIEGECLLKSKFYGHKFPNIARRNKASLPSRVDNIYEIETHKKYPPL